MKRILFIAFIAIASAIALIALMMVCLAAFKWNWAKPWLGEHVSEATERPLVIAGDLTLSWQRAPGYQQIGPQAGSRAWMPWPHLRARNVTFGNPKWASTGPTMARIQQVDFTVDLLALLQKTIVVRSLLLTEPQLVLEQAKDGRTNWTFEQQENTSRWKFKLEDLSVYQGTVRYVDPVKRADVITRIDTLNDGSVVWKMKGAFNGDQLIGNGKAGALLSMHARAAKYPVEASLEAGETKIHAEGTLTDPAHLSALDIDLRIQGASMADLFPISGVFLPETPKFSTQGRVVGSVKPNNFHLRYEKFKGKAGSSDIEGTLEYLRKGARPLLRGAVVSNHLNLKDLGALIGSYSDASGEKTRAVPQPPDKVLPVDPLKTDRWGKWMCR